MEETVDDVLQEVSNNILNRIKAEFKPDLPLLRQSVNLLIHSCSLPDSEQKVKNLIVGVLIGHLQHAYPDLVLP